MDIYAFRVIVNDSTPVIACSGKCIACTSRVRVAERLHRHSKSERLSVFAHLNVGPHGVPVEVQIRTEDMDQMQRWVLPRTGLIKSTAKPVLPANPRPALDAKPAGAATERRCSFEFIESVKSDLFPDEIYVSHRKGAL